MAVGEHELSWEEGKATVFDVARRKVKDVEGGKHSNGLVPRPQTCPSHFCCKHADGGLKVPASIPPIDVLFLRTQTRRSTRVPRRQALTA